MNTYHHPSPFALDCGAVLPSLELAYHTYGSAENPVVWVCHALTANSDVADWWPGTVVEGGFLDPKRYFVVCANILGSCYGSTGPMSVDPATGERWYDDFPALTIRDIARANLLLADHLGIARVRAIVGGSIGGFQALEMEILRPGFAERLALVATSAVATPWCVALNESHRMAIEADCSWGERRVDAAQRGLAAARSIGLLSYRGPAAYNATQQGEGRAASYQRYQGEKFVKRFDAYSYYALTRAMDSHDVRGGLDSIACPVCIVGITTDIILPPVEQEFLAGHLPDARFHLIESDFGHDGFLVEHRKLNDIFAPFIL